MTLGRCPTCGRGVGPKLADWERQELLCRAQGVLAEYPRFKGFTGRERAQRSARLGYLAAEYGISLRTLYRYLRRAA